MKNSRTGRAIKNVSSSIIYEIVALVCGLILPRLILSNFGSAYNGIVSSVTQFISCISLMKAGIGGATKAALYKPLANKDNKEISEVVVATSKFMKKVALFFIVFVLVFSCLYPLIINKEFDFIFSSTLIIIVSISTFAEYFFCYTYQLLLMSDQKEYILTLINITTTILNTILAVILIKTTNSIHIVKLGSAIVYLIAPITLSIYVKKHYNIDNSIKVSEDKLPQRWDAVAHELATFVNNNTDIMVLTIFTNLLEVSVYTVYHNVINNIKKAIKTSVSNFDSAFGDMYAKNEIDLMNKNLGIFELIINSIVSIIHSTTLVMIVPFVMLYTKGVTDVNYYRYTFAIIAVLASAFDCLRMPYRTIVASIGHFKQTRNGAIFEAVLNIVLSLLLVYKFGLIGVAIGTLVAMMFRTIQYAYYLSKKVLNRNLFNFINHIVLTIAIIVVVSLISKTYIGLISNWLYWILYALLTTLIAITITLITNYIFYREDLKTLFSKLKKGIKK